MDEFVLGAFLERSDDSDKDLGLGIAFLQLFTYLAFVCCALRGLSSAAPKPQISSSGLKY